jgi:hypothetical protein
VRNATYLWTATEVVSASSSTTEISFLSKIEILKGIMQGVSTDKRKLSIPKSNLVEDLIVTFSVTVSNSSNSWTDSIDVTIKTVYKVQSMDQLKVSQELIYVEPTTGVSGTDEFTATYILTNV